MGKSYMETVEKKNRYLPDPWSPAVASSTMFSNMRDSNVFKAPYYKDYQGTTQISDQVLHASKTMSSQAQASS